MRGAIVIANRDHAVRMAPNLRAAEVRELMDGDGIEPLPALLRELERSRDAWAWVVDGDVACMFGVVAPNLIDYSAYPWFLTTPLVETNHRAFARACRELLPELMARYPRLSGMVDARYEISVRWLEWLGAKLGEPQPWGINGMLFRPFELGE